MDIIEVYRTLELLICVLAVLIAGFFSGYTVIVAGNSKHPNYRFLKKKNLFLRLDRQTGELISITSNNKGIVLHQGKKHRSGVIYDFELLDNNQIVLYETYHGFYTIINLKVMEELYV